MSDLTPKERFEARKALLTTLTQANASGFAEVTFLTRYTGGREQVTGKRWVSYLTPREVLKSFLASNETQIDIDQIIPCTHLHQTQTSASKCATTRLRELPADSKIES
jgi:hypothetical protein